ncbi:hypothetical protein CKO15_00720 [Halorhodospira abdelmalekii]|uniref:Rrf2 family transcriptional regulator n=1 Tax=Halorhodospira abdelmalekii TaxID=421629 RepID=UPI001902C4D9|nr:Rrf2 family transcriptional regulator [Halorhodospira abdelmalekii]MBK1733825.1 hypothetical protein [Halorhodospira abdelmalekii]
MRLSTRGRYAVAAMLELTVHAGQRPVTLAEISKSQGISLSYLEQLFAALRREGLVYGVRGPGGGYRLAKAAEQITAAQIIMAVDGYVGTPPEIEGDGEEDPGVGLWADLSRQVYELLDRMTLQEMAAGVQGGDAVYHGSLTESVHEARDRTAAGADEESPLRSWGRAAHR